MNDFVSYLNSLNRCKGTNDNTIAEANFNNKYQKEILCSNKDVIEKILACVSSRGGKCILTGSAGDGKTTLAFEVAEQLLRNGYHKEDYEISGIIKYCNGLNSILIIKDFSERDKRSDDKLIKNVVLSPETSVLLVTNTGTLVNFAKDNSELFDSSKLEMEKAALEAISATNGISQISFGKETYKLYNIAQMNNLHISKGIFRKIINNDSWNNTCANCQKREFCPILFNILSIRRSEEVIVRRMFYIYERMYLYGNRYTVRQMLEHFTYTLTSGCSCSDIKPGMKRSSHIFSNAFFGVDKSSEEQSVISEIKKANFGGYLPSSFVRKVCLDINGGKTPYALSNPMLEDYVGGLNVNNDFSRIVLYRIYYFASTNLEPEYEASFLNSPSFTLWKKIQDGGELTGRESNRLNATIIHVVKEYFSGVKLPQNENDINSEIYITLNRHEMGVVQTAQAVIAHFSSGEFKLSEVQSDNGFIEFVLKKNRVTQGPPIELRLSLPFLDYLVRQHYGIVEDYNSMTYLKRLDVFKNEILSDFNCNNPSADSNQMLLVKLEKKDGKVRLGQIKFTLTQNGRLEAVLQ